MNANDIHRAAEQEASWLKYYCLREDREKEAFDDADFYDRVRSIGYTKRVIPLPLRCAFMHLTSSKPVLKCTIEELNEVSGPRRHSENVYTALEYVVATKFPGYEKLIELVKS